VYLVMKRMSKDMGKIVAGCEKIKVEGLTREKT
jgi:hypothetical protein